MMVCLAPISAVFAVAGLLLYAGIAHVFARLLDGTGSYSDLVYAYAAFMAPLSLLTSILFAIPFLNFCLSIPAAIFYLILAVIAVSAVNQLGTGKSLISVVVGPIGIALFVVCGVIFLLMLAGPQIGDVFSSIIEELSTPIP